MISADVLTGRGVTRRAVILALTAGAGLFGAGAPALCLAQGRRRPARIGLLSSGQTAVQEERYGLGFRRALREHGWIEGENYTLEHRFAEGSPGRLPQLAADLVDLNVDAILALGPPAAGAARSATTTIPIVFAGIVDPVALGLVQTLARPGTNATGLTFATGPELSAELFELLKEIAPAAARVAFLYNAANQAGALYAAAIEEAAGRRAVQLGRFGARDAADLDMILKRITDWRPDGLLLVGDSLTISHRARIIEFALRHRLPAVYGFRQFAEDGGLVAYSWNEAEMLKRLAALVDKVLKGSRPSDLPVEQPKTFELVVNLKTAKALNVRIPPSLLVRADHVIQ